MTWVLLDLRTDVKALRDEPTMSPVEVPVASEAAPPPAVSDSDACTGVVAAEHQRAKLAERGAAVFACGAHLPPAVPPPSLNLTLRISADGQVDRVSLDGSVTDATTRACVGQEVIRWRFPALNTGSCATLSLPFVFGATERSANGN